MDTRLGSSRVLMSLTRLAKDTCGLRKKGNTQTHLGSLPASHLEADLWESIDSLVCRTCQRTLLHLEDLNLTTAHLETMTKVCREFRKTATSLSITF